MVLVYVEFLIDNGLGGGVHGPQGSGSGLSLGEGPEVQVSIYHVFYCRVLAIHCSVFHGLSFHDGNMILGRTPVTDKSREDDADRGKSYGEPKDNVPHAGVFLRKGCFFCGVWIHG